MSGKPMFDSWKIAKYKPLQRAEAPVTESVTLANDPSRKLLIVYSQGREIDRVFYHMIVHKYPILKFKGNYFYVYHNEAGNGFRLTFQSSEDQFVFMKTMQKLAYVSESPAKSSPCSQDPIQQIDSWAFARELKKSPASRSLTAMSQPYVRNPYSPQSSYPMPMSQPACLDYSDRDPFLDNGSPSSQFSNPSSQFSMFSGYSGFSGFSQPYQSASSGPSSDTGRLSQVSNRSIDPFTPPMPVIVQKDDKSCQTESSEERLFEDPEALKSMIKKLMKDPSFIDAVKKVRVEIRQMDDNELEEFKKSTETTSEPKILHNLDSGSKRAAAREDKPTTSGIPPKRPAFQVVLDRIGK